MTREFSRVQSRSRSFWNPQDRGSARGKTDNRNASWTLSCLLQLGRQHPAQHQIDSGYSTDVSQMAACSSWRPSPVDGRDYWVFLNHTIVLQLPRPHSFCLGSPPKSLFQRHFQHPFWNDLSDLPDFNLISPSVKAPPGPPKIS